MKDAREHLVIQVVTAVSLLLAVICMFTGGVMALAGFVGLNAAMIAEGLVFYAVGLPCLWIAGWDQALKRLWREEDEAY